MLLGSRITTHQGVLRNSYGFDGWFQRQSGPRGQLPVRTKSQQTMKSSCIAVGPPSHRTCLYHNQSDKQKWSNLLLCYVHINNDLLYSADSKRLNYPVPRCMLMPMSSIAHPGTTIQYGLCWHLLKSLSDEETSTPPGKGCVPHGQGHGQDDHATHNLPISKSRHEAFPQSLHPVQTTCICKSYVKSLQHIVTPRSTLCNTKQNKGKQSLRFLLIAIPSCCKELEPLKPLRLGTGNNRDLMNNRLQIRPLSTIFSTINHPWSDWSNLGPPSHLGHRRNAMLQPLGHLPNHPRVIKWRCNQSIPIRCFWLSLCKCFLPPKIHPGKLPDPLHLDPWPRSFNTYNMQ